jgi:transcriptional regulator with XRE-family HTH domain
MAKKPPAVEAFMPDSDDWLKRLGLSLANLRGRRSQESVASEIGVATSTLSRYERGEQEPGAATLAKLIFVLGGDPVAVLGFRLQSGDGGRAEHSQAAPAEPTARAFERLQDQVDLLAGALRAHGLLEPAPVPLEKGRRAS